MILRISYKSYPTSSVTYLTLPSYHSSDNVKAPSAFARRLSGSILPLNISHNNNEFPFHTIATLEPRLLLQYSYTRIVLHAKQISSTT